MISRKKTTRFSQKQRQSNEPVSQPARLSFFSKLAQRFPAKVGGAAISALIVLHFVSQFIFFQNENVQDEIAPPKIEIEQVVENEQFVEMKPEYVPAKPDAVTMSSKPHVAPPAAALPGRKAAPLPKTVKKKQPRESRAARLRRAEKILTGV